MPADAFRFLQLRPAERPRRRRAGAHIHLPLPGLPAPHRQPFANQARFRREDVTLSGASTAYARVGDSGGHATFHFCPRCGATVYFMLEGLADIVAIPVGAFADPGFPAPMVSIYEERMHGWIQPPRDAAHIA
jgi:hypothetical protein